MTYETCEHGLSADLCAGPGHYPPDGPEDDYASTPGEVHSDWHRRNGAHAACPWDCLAGEPPEPCHLLGYNSDVDYGCTPAGCKAPVDLTKYYAGQPWDRRTTAEAKAAQAAAYASEPPF